MFGGSAFSAAPFSSVGTGGVFADYLTDQASATDTSTTAAFVAVTSVSEIGNLTDALLLIASTFNASTADTLTGSETTSVLVDFTGLVAESGQVDTTVVVAPSVFGATVNETVSVADFVLAVATFFATMTDGAVGVDTVVAWLLWEDINDSQNAAWAQQSDEQTAMWGVLDDAQTSGWTPADDTQNPSWSTVGNAQSNPWSVNKT